MNNFSNHRQLWSTFAGMSLMSRNLDLIETSYQELEKIENLLFIHKIKSINDEAKKCELLVLTGNVKEAENLMIQSTFVLRAILLNVCLSNWNRALDLAVNAEAHQEDKVLVKLVVSLRKQFLRKQGIEREKIKEFIEAEDSVSSENEAFIPFDDKKIESFTQNPYDFKTSSIKIVKKK
jgi:hypothetical protein